MNTALYLNFSMWTRVTMLKPDENHSWCQLSVLTAQTCHGVTSKCCPDPFQSGWRIDANSPCGREENNNDARGNNREKLVLYAMPGELADALRPCLPQTLGVTLSIRSRLPKSTQSLGFPVDRCNGQVQKSCRCVCGLRQSTVCLSEHGGAVTWTA